MKKHRASRWMIPVALLCLCEPALFGFDCLPDILAFILLPLAVWYYGAAEKNFKQDYRRTKRQIVLWLGVFLAFLFLSSSFMGLSDNQLNAYEKPTYSLTLHFVVLVLQCVFVMPIVGELLDDLGILLHTYQKTDVDLDFDGYKRCFKRTIIVRSVCAVLPEASVLTAFENDVENPLFPFSMLPCRNVLRLLFGAVATIVFVIFAVKTVRFFKAYFTTLDEDAIQSTITERVTAHPEWKRHELFRIATSLLLFAVVFTDTLKIDDRVLLPSAVSTVLVCLAVLLLGSDFTYRRAFLIAVPCVLAVSVVFIVLTERYLSYYLPESAEYLPRAYAQYWWVRCFGVIEALTSTGLVTGLFYHLSSDTVRQLGAYSKDGTPLPGGDNLARQLRVKMILPTLSLLSSGIANALALGLFTVTWLWMVALGLTVLSCVLVATCLSEIRYEVFEFAVGED